MDEFKEEVDKTKSSDKLYVLFNNYKNWLSKDHPEITPIILIIGKIGI